MSRVFVFTGGYRPDHPSRDVRLVNEIIRRGHDVTYAVGGPAVSNVPHPQDVAARPEFRAVDAQWINNEPDLVRLLADADVFLADIWSKTNARFVQIAKSLGVVTVQHDIHGLDVRYLGADWVCVRSEFFAQERIRRRQVDPGRIVITGSTLADAACDSSVQNVSREEFCQKYGIDVSKKIAVWLPSAPQNLADWEQRKYQEVCDTIRANPDYALVVKLHPTDYMQRKAGFFGGKTSHEILVPWAPLIEPEDAYKTYAVCDVGVSLFSSVSLEFALFKKPFIYVDANQSPVRTFHSTKEWFSDAAVPAVAGIYCTAEELPQVLATDAYVPSDPEIYDELVAKYYYRNDGQAFARIADVVERATGQVLESSRRFRRQRANWWILRHRLKRALRGVAKELGVRRLRGRKTSEAVGDNATTSPHGTS